MDVRKTMTDAGYIAIGLGVMGAQQAQVRRRKVQKRLQEAPGCVTARAREVQDRFAEQGRQAEQMTRTGVARAEELRREVGKRVEPLIEQLTARVSEVPEKVVQAMEPVAARVRELAGSAA